MSQEEKDFLNQPPPIIIATIQGLAVEQKKLPDYPLDGQSYMVLRNIVDTHRHVGVRGITQIIVSFCRGYAEGRAYQDEYISKKK
jgi:hypothetical protein